ncbi:hypothetical protein N7522_006876 [Penicillium canescens]|nr:hypothetical protein N7522_006876 [Penicillium canescens]
MGPMQLNVDVLGDIAEFKRYVCTVWTPGAIFITFYVKYNSGSEGYVYGGPSIHGKASSEFHLLELHVKIGAAKALPLDGEWYYLRRKYGIEKEPYLILRRDKI